MKFVSLKLKFKVKLILKSTHHLIITDKLLSFEKYTIYGAFNLILSNFVGGLKP